MTVGPVLIDSDTLSELSRGHSRVTGRARAYLEAHGRLTISSVSVFERLRGYRAALRLGEPFDAQLRQFEMFAASCTVLPVDALVADRAATIWANLGTRGRRSLGDILIAATASAYGLGLATRNRRDFQPMVEIEGIDVTLFDWTKD